MVIRVTQTEVRQDDITGEVSDDVREFTFKLDSTIYTIDACLETREAIRDALLTFTRVSRTRFDPSGHDTKAVREWAQEKGIPVLENGRVSDAVILAYIRAHP